MRHSRTKPVIMAHKLYLCNLISVLALRFSQVGDARDLGFMRSGAVRARNSRESGKCLVPVLKPVDHQYRLIARFIVAPSVLLPIPVPCNRVY